MRIEAEILNFNPKIDLNKLANKLELNDIKKQYLTFLIAQESIQSLTDKLFKNGWLVNFQFLFELIETLVQNKVLMNTTIIQYFSHLQVLSTKPSVYQNLTSESRKPTFEELQKIIGNNAFFRNLSLPLSLLILEKSIFKKIKMDVAICTNGATDRNMYILTKGQAAVYKIVSQKRQFISIIHPMGLFGESSFLQGHPKSADVISLQNSEVLEIPCDSAVLDKAINQKAASALIHRFWIQNALSNSDFFKKIPADCLDALTFSGRTIQLKNNEILFNQNDKSNAAYLIIQGQIKIIQNQKIISSLNQGQFFGEISLTMTNGLRTASALSNGDTTLLEVERNQFYKLLSENLFLAKEIQNLAFERFKNDRN